MRYYNRVLTLSGYEICSLRDLLSDYDSNSIIASIDSVIDSAFEQKIIIDSRVKSSYDFHNNMCIVNGNVCNRINYGKAE